MSPETPRKQQVAWAGCAWASSERGVAVPIPDPSAAARRCAARSLDRHACTSLETFMRCSGVIWCSVGGGDLVCSGGSSSLAAPSRCRGHGVLAPAAPCCLADASRRCCCRLFFHAAAAFCARFVSQEPRVSSPSPGGVTFLRSTGSPAASRALGVSWTLKSVSVCGTWRSSFRV